MKKIFTLVAAAVMALSANAQKVIDFSTATDADFTDLVNFTLVDYQGAPSLSYVSPDQGSFKVFGVTLKYKNSADKDNFIKMNKQGVVTNGKGVTVEYTTNPNAEVEFEVAAKGGTKPVFGLPGQKAADVVPLFDNSGLTNKVDGVFPTAKFKLTADANGLVSFTEYVAGFTFVKLTDSQTSGINEVANDKSDVNAPVYNLAGQRVSKDAKGILIQNGKKFINK